MKLTAKELTRILNQPGYAIDSLTAHSGPGDDLRLGGQRDSQESAHAPQRLACAAWRNEREFQRAVVDAYAAWAAVNGWTAILCHVANENAHRMPGIVAGMPDLILFAGAEKGALFIELKIGSGKLRESQREIHHRLRRMGYRVVTVWDSVEDVLFEIEAFLKGD